MAETFDIIGMGDLKKKLAALPSRIEKNILRSMVRAGAQVVRKAAAANANEMDKFIVIKASRRKSRGKIVMEVGPSKAKWYLKFKETGTKPHVIETGKKKVLSNGEVIFGVKVQHPGQAANPFMRPALDQNVPKIIEAMRKQGEKRVEKEAAKGKT